MAEQNEKVLHLADGAEATHADGEWSVRYPKTLVNWKASKTESAAFDRIAFLEAALEQAQTIGMVTVLHMNLWENDQPELAAYLKEKKENPNA